MLRQQAPFIADADGWGVYAERRAVEMGSLLGTLSTDSLWAARRVIDTGLHLDAWIGELVASSTA